MKCYKYVDGGDNGISKVTGNGLDSMIQFLEVAGIFLFIVMYISSQRLIHSHIHSIPWDLSECLRGGCNDNAIYLEPLNNTKEKSCKNMHLMGNIFVGCKIIW